MFRRLVIVVFASGLTACAARADVTVATGAPALVPPTPPTRLVVPIVEKPTLPDVEPEVSQPPAPTTPPRPRETRPPVTQTPPPTPPATQVETPPSAPAVLSTSANTARFALRIREQLNRAIADLNQVNPRTLGADARAQYDAAQGFIRQCEDALKVRNLMFASQLADKAATMAALLRR